MVRSAFIVVSELRSEVPVAHDVAAQQVVPLAPEADVGRNPHDDGRDVAEAVMILPPGPG
jgi:hypothetical protein